MRFINGLWLVVLMVLVHPVTASTHYIDWMHRQQAPINFSFTQSTPTQVILADDIDLGELALPQLSQLPRWVPIPAFIETDAVVKTGLTTAAFEFKHRYRYDTPPDNLPRQLVLIAETLRISDQVFFHLQSRDAEIGGQLLIIARQIIVGEKGLLSFKSSGKRGGDLSIIYDSLTFDPKLPAIENRVENWLSEISDTFEHIASAIPDWQPRRQDLIQRQNRLLQTVQNNGWDKWQRHDLKQAARVKQAQVEQLIQFVQQQRAWRRDRDILITDLVNHWEKAVLPVWLEHYRKREKAYYFIRFLLPIESLVYFLVWEPTLITTKPLFQKPLIDHIKRRLPTSLPVTLTTQKEVIFDKPGHYRTRQTGVAWQSTVWFESESDTAQETGTFSLLSSTLSEAPRYAPAEALSKWSLLWLEKRKNQIKEAFLKDQPKPLEKYFQQIDNTSLYPIISQHQERYSKILAALATLKQKWLGYASNKITLDVVIHPSRKMVIFYLTNYDDKDYECDYIRVAAQVKDKQGNIVARREIKAFDIKLPAHAMENQVEAGKKIIKTLETYFEQPKIVEVGEPSYRCKAL